MHWFLGYKIPCVSVKREIYGDIEQVLKVKIFGLAAIQDCFSIQHDDQTNARGRVVGQDFVLSANATISIRF